MAPADSVEERTHLGSWAVSRLVLVEVIDQPASRLVRLAENHALPSHQR
jgi:hypothetical protein